MSATAHACATSQATEICPASLSFERPRQDRYTPNKGNRKSAQATENATKFQSSTACTAWAGRQIDAATAPSTINVTSSNRASTPCTSSEAAFRRISATVLIILPLLKNER